MRPHDPDPPEESELARAARELLGASAVPLAGGYSGETYLVAVAGEEVVLRLYLERPERAAVDAALHRLVRGLLPVPRVLDANVVAVPDAPAHLLFERLPGIRLEQFLDDPAVDASRRRRAGEEAAVQLARLSGMPFLRAGLFDGPDLTVRPLPSGGLEQWTQAHRERGHLAEWSGADLARLLDVATAAQVLLDSGDRVCLCHSDFNAKNVLVDPATGAITGLVDWEYAHAGMPHADLGNLLRFETDEVFGTAVAETYRELVPGGAEGDFLDRARAADLYALIDLAARPAANRITRQADELLLRIARDGDLAGGRPRWA
ncbi:MAG TPA: phosphotransferase [Actinopolymorphaceae bacterium]